MHQGRIGLSDFNKVTCEKATLFFFTNFQDTWDSGALCKMFSRYGKVVDVYVEFKKTKKDTRFGFVRFINVWEINIFERRLKRIQIGDTKIIINRVKFIKGSDRGVLVADLPQFPGPRIRATTTMPNVGHTFRDDILGQKVVVSL